MRGAQRERMMGARRESSPTLRHRWQRFWHRVEKLLLAAVIVGGAVLGNEALRFSFGDDDEPISELEEAPRLEAARDRIRIVFAGDTHFGESYAVGTRRAGFLEERGYGYVLERLAPLLRSADLVLANLETPLTARHEPAQSSINTFLHWGDPLQTPVALRAGNIHALGLANNHSLDMSAAGLADTERALAAEHLEAFGAGSTLAQAARPLVRDIQIGDQQLRLAVIGLFERQWQYWWFGYYASPGSAGAYGPRLETIQARLAAYKQADPDLFVVVFPHWGQNYQWSTTSQRQWGRALIDAGADLVLGHGAHVFQEVERYRDRWILYGLGNFVFLSGGRFQQHHIHPYGIVAALDLRQQSASIGMALRLYFIASDNRQTGFVPYLLAGQAFDQAYRVLLDQGSRPAGAVQQWGHQGEDEFGPYVQLELGKDDDG